GRARQDRLWGSSGRGAHRPAGAWRRELRLSAWRLVKTKNLSHAWTGEGARLYGGRWNNVGIKMVYTADSLALALLEVLVHLQDTGVLPAYSAIRAEFDEKLVTP